MRIKVFSVYDIAAAAYLPPFFVPEVAQAARYFVESVADERHAFSRSPEDYSLFHLGEFEQNTAQFDLFPAMVPVVTGVEAVALVQKRKERKS